MQNQDQVLSFGLKPKFPATIIGGVPRRKAIPEIGEATATLDSLSLKTPKSVLVGDHASVLLLQSWRGAC
ncbi:hypothetical protein V6N12_042147 [Hibiscus sabdariffa]|uniref:Uncharacterized protein n=1 Tax=Hibiscus sabdariffa TaxID=183260 RepID=A0ABR2EEC7_9ROSI